MTVGIIDADLIGRTRHRFPNLACMKLSAYHKNQGDTVALITDYKGLDEYDKLYLSKVFTDTEVPEEILSLPRLSYGGSGFFYDKAPPLPQEVEHIMPDYSLYEPWVNSRLAEGGKRLDYKYYLDYSIGFLTRGCFRQCPFCINQNYKKVERHSPLQEFLDPNRRAVCLLDDNFFGCPQWRELLTELRNCGKPFQFKQGLDERLLTDEKCELLFTSRYDGDFIFAFDNIADKELIEEKAKMIRRHYKKTGHNIKFYVLCGFDREDRYDEAFWVQDLKDSFERVFLLARYNFKPYIMRFERYRESPLYGSYVNLACWCNQPSFFFNYSLQGFCEKDDLRKSKGTGRSATWTYFLEMCAADQELAAYAQHKPKDLVLDYQDW